MIVSETPDFFQIACDAQTRIAELQWDRYTDSKTYQDNYRLLVQVMKAEELNCALLDVRERGEVPYTDQVWVCQKIFPAMLTELNGQVKLAYILNADHFISLQSESPNGEMETFGDLLKIQFFVDERAARRWLQSI
ncbi:hypothetical protein HUW51_04480 [Adhaeribacter swui]|uniref:STAS/SEC14 domain-containing protein n=1 Tax=Adhaeribacter swui TaxID=2086471 RepID=A0A7G7G4D4_9BACT|nr:hypothetical protein [Adhaeribacter swui]QNF32018.1 hypothetical protein HUW51_04480 [Adhaeribacter swui]